QVVWQVLPTALYAVSAREIPAIEPTAEYFMNALARLLKPLLPWALAFCLTSSSFGAELPELADLVKDLKSDKPNTRARAAESLGRLGPAAAPAVPQLIAALGDKVAAVQRESLIALDRIGPAAREAVPALVALLKGETSRNYDAAIHTLGAIGRDSAEA